jgi:hypothetical protein
MLGEASNTKTTVGVLAMTLFIGLFLASRWSASLPRSVTGTVQSSGAISAAKVQGGTQAAASVRLSTGRLVTAYVVSGGPVAPGDKVRLLEQTSLLGTAAYQIVAKERVR